MNPQVLGVTKAAAWLLFLSFLSGFYLAAVVTGQVDADAHAAAMAHISGIFGALILFALGWSQSMLQLSSGQQKLQIGSLVVACFGNWAITLLKSAFKVSAIGFNDDPINNFIFCSLFVVVVIPSMMGSGLWVWGLRQR